MYAILALKGSILIAKPTLFTDSSQAVEGLGQEMVWSRARK